MIDWEHPKIVFALEFARAHHEGQTRKYTFEPYIEHPIAVAEMVGNHLNDVETICAAILHDVVEDTDVTIEEVNRLFGAEVAEYVWYLTKPPAFVGNRAKRKQIDCDRLQQAPALVRFIKVMDIWHNSLSIKEYDPKFYETFREEVKVLLDVMTGYQVVREFAGPEFANEKFMTWFGEL